MSKNYGHSFFARDMAQGVWKSRASWAPLGERNVKKKKKYFFFLTFWHSYNTCINVTNVFQGQIFYLKYW